MANPDNYDHMFKIVLIGDSGSGKTNILSRITRNTFDPASKSTIGVEFSTRVVEFDGKLIKTQIWDTAGQERYRAIASAYYRGAVAALLVFDITKYESFENVNRWFNEIRDYGSLDIVVVLIGNKYDLRAERTVEREEAEKFAKNLSLSYFETSALDATNIEEMFQATVRLVYEAMKKRPDSDDDSPTEGKGDKGNPSGETPLSAGIKITPVVENHKVESKSCCCLLYTSPSPRD
eukprot:TRINITY_DN4683_c0_g1_i1.p1 TRINITY_DN4683_c0_g1~~TRINITY_DN4683_c0_g1_i1.p1  ORF type:complete len:235 (-),score=61.84 TRINITY_DN4683_c0_g1_i1:32-736(-)